MLENREVKKRNMDEYAPQDNPDCNPPVPLRYWEIEKFFTCPIVGMCLTQTEQKQLLKKTGNPIKRKTPFEIHEVLVGSSNSENPLSRKIDRLLNHKFGKGSAFFLDLDEKKFTEHWDACFKTGDFKSILWAAATHPELSSGCRARIFGTIHMVMHENAEENGCLRDRLSALQETVDDLNYKMKRKNQANRKLKKENDALALAEEAQKARLTRSEYECAKLEKELAEIKGLPMVAKLEQENRRLKEELDGMSEKIERRILRIATLEDENSRLKEELERQRESSAWFNKKTNAIMEEVLANNACDESCPSFDLCRKRVLIVGGITKMEALYRQVIESSGGVFDYHDGYMQKGMKKLESSLKRADLILCPVSCNSHTACVIVKNLGKKYNKPVQMLAGAGISAVSQAIRKDMNGAGIGN